LLYYSCDEQSEKGRHAETPAQDEEAGDQEEGRGPGREEARPMKSAWLLPGRPGVGKTSLIRELVARVKGKAGGFYTEEIRAGGARLGFRLVTLDGQETTLAHTSIRSPHRVSRYGVDIGGLERVGVAAVQKAIAESDLIVIDEIGKMELFSDKFRQAVTQAVASGKRVLGTIMLSPHPWADAIKSHPGVRVVALTRENRGRVLADIGSWLEEAGVTA